MYILLTSELKTVENCFSERKNRSKTYVADQINMCAPNEGLTTFYITVPINNPYLMKSAWIVFATVCSDSAPLTKITNTLVKTNKFQLGKFYSIRDFIVNTFANNSTNYLSFNGMIIQYIPQTVEYCNLAVQQNALALQFVKDEFHTAELSHIAVQQNALALQFVKDEFHTAELSQLAVQQNGCALQFVKNKFHTQELITNTINWYVNDINYNLGFFKYMYPQMYSTQLIECVMELTNGRALRYIPKQYITIDLLTRFVTRNGLLLSDVPYKDQTYDLCHRAVTEMSYAFQYVNPRFKTFEFCIHAIKQDKNECGYNIFPKIIKMKKFTETQKMILKKVAVQTAGGLLQYISPAERSVELCTIAITQYPYAIQFIFQIPNTIVPRGVKQALCFEAVYKLSRTIALIPPEFMSVDLCFAAIQLNPYNICNISPTYLTPVMYMCAVLQDGCVLQFIKKQYQTPDLCMAGVRQHPRAIQYVYNKTNTLWDVAFSTRQQQQEQQEQQQEQQQQQVIPRHIAIRAIQSAVSSGETCNITYEPLTILTTSITHCGHIFITSAIRQWFGGGESGQCPECRTLTSLC